ncbi:MAG: hypothetical protein Q9218_004592 [Villophora microphyllina]
MLPRSISTSTPKSADTSDPLPQPPIQAPDATSDAAGSTQSPTDQSASPSMASPLAAADPTIQNQRPSMLGSIRQAKINNKTPTRSPTSSSASDSISNLFSSATSSSSPSSSSAPYTAARSFGDFSAPIPQPHHLHIYSTKHNTHITLTSPTRQPIISVSSGTIGFRKAMRGSYDAGYQLGAYVLGRIQQQGLLTQIQQLEVVLRDFGPGREAVTKILLGSEGRNIRGRIIRVCDATRLKFGGTRSKKPRRLG